MESFLLQFCCLASDNNRDQLCFEVIGVQVCSSMSQNRCGLPSWCEKYYSSLSFAKTAGASPTNTKHARPSPKPCSVYNSTALLPASSISIRFHQGFMNTPTGTPATTADISTLATYLKLLRGQATTRIKISCSLKKISPYTVPKAAIASAESCRHLYWKLCYSFTDWQDSNVAIWAKQVGLLGQSRTKVSSSEIVASRNTRKVLTARDIFMQGRLHVRRHSLRRAFSAQRQQARIEQNPSTSPNNTWLMECMPRMILEKTTSPCSTTPATARAVLASAPSRYSRAQYLTTNSTRTSPNME